LADVMSLDATTLVACLSIFWIAVLLLLLHVIKATREVDRRMKNLKRHEDS
jgi:beta-lactamase regulating signal transducer with metallopeptidase domain